MMDWAKTSDPSGDSAFMAASIPSRTFSISKATPMMPVEFTSTFSFVIDIARAVCSAIARASAYPCLPVHAFAFPALATIARTVPRRMWRRVSCTGAAWTRLVVNTPAAAAGRSDTSMPRSRFPLGLRPHATPDAVYPSADNSSTPCRSTNAL